MFRLGLTEKFEFRVVSQIELNSTFNPRVTNPSYRSSFSDIQVGAKFQLYRKEGAKTEALILGQYSIPKGNTARKEQQFFGKLCVSHQLAENISLGYNLGYRSTGTLDYVDYSCAVSYSVTDKLSVFAEQYGQLNLSNVSVVPELGDMFGYDAGLAYLINDRLQLDWVIGSGINIDMNFVSVGCSALIMR